ncbi:MAG TPA: hypothetical protein VGI17_13165 [Solirubrobacterales bacterium]|jgi:hypothetical protein
MGSPEAARIAARSIKRSGSGAHPLAVMGAVALVLVAFFAVVSSADAAHFQRPFKEVFGSAAQPSVSQPYSVAVDRKTGDVLVSDRATESISRFKADGTPAPFAALGTNVIDGREANGKPCAEEPASCDKAPQNGIVLPREVSETEIAVDESGGPTDGDIYITLSEINAVDIFAADGSYLGQLTAVGEVPYTEGPFGVAIDPTGSVYVTSVTRDRTGHFFALLDKYVPSANPPVNEDVVLSSSHVPTDQSLMNIALGAGPTAGLVFGTSTNGIGDSQAYELNAQTGEVEFKFGFDIVGEGTVAVDPQTGTVLLPARGHAGEFREGPFREVLEFEVPQGAEPIRISRIFAPSERNGFAVTASSEVVLADRGPHLEIYGTPGIVPTVTVESATEVIGTKATVAGTVNPSGPPVTGCFFEYGETTKYGKTAPCEGTIGEDANAHPVQAELAGLKPNGTTYHFRLVATNANGTEESPDQSLTTAGTTVTEAATAIGLTGATFNGTVRPEGEAYSACFFEYGLSSSSTFEKTVPCSPGAAAITPDFGPHSVKAAVSGLKVGTQYRFRLVATNSFGTVKGDEMMVTTHGAPRLSDVRASNADQSAVTLEGKINPSGFATSYRFEWGPTASYGHVLPAEFEPFVGSGEAPVRVSVKITGLSMASTYHYRLVAGSEEGGVTASSDEIFETLNSCGLSEGRCDELVSRRDAGPFSIPGEFFSPVEMHYQAATSGTGLAYPVESGYPEATKGAEVLYRAQRGPTEWGSTQLSAPISEANQQPGVQSGNGPVEWLSNDLSCGFQVSNSLLTSDPSTRLVREYGGSNLYRLNPDGSHTAVSNLTPENPEHETVGHYEVAGATQDCRKVVFVSDYRYPGVPTTPGNELNLYEWDEGTLRSVGFVPGEAGEEVPVDALPGNGTATDGNSQNVVSEDGSRVFFSAVRETSANPAEVGRRGIFVRENGTETRDVSESETGVSDTGATYQWATPDGSKVFFLANAGLTAESSPSGTDLYMYDLESDQLTDVSVWTNPENPTVGAEAAGFVAASADGSEVYFAARGQLVPGKGNSYAQNQAEGTYSVFGESGGNYTYVGKISSAGGPAGRVILNHQGVWSSEASPDGRYLLFESTENIAGYNSGGTAEAYLYNAQSGSAGTICVSCRQDGQPSVGPTGEGGGFLYTTLPTEQSINNPLHPPHFLVEREGRPMVFFSSADVLAPGAVEHQNNVYEWSHGQVFRLASAQPGQQSPFPFAGYFATPVGAGNNGSDVYFVTPETLTWEDGDARLSVYDARIGGGYPQPSAPAPACNATAEKSCQAPTQGTTTVPRAVTPDVTVSENFEAAKKKSTKKPPKKTHKKKAHHKAKKKRSNKQAARHANSNRGAGK